MSGMGFFSPRCRRGAALERAKLSKLPPGLWPPLLVALLLVTLGQLLLLLLWQLLVGLRLLSGTSRLLLLQSNNLKIYKYVSLNFSLCTGQQQGGKK
jgi:hypothetical protein